MRNHPTRGRARRQREARDRCGRSRAVANRCGHRSDLGGRDRPSKEPPSASFVSLAGVDRGENGWVERLLQTAGAQDHARRIGSIRYNGLWFRDRRRNHGQVQCANPVEPGTTPARGSPRCQYILLTNPPPAIPATVDTFNSSTAQAPPVIVAPNVRACKPPSASRAANHPWAPPCNTPSMLRG